MRNMPRDLLPIKKLVDSKRYTDAADALDQLLQEREKIMATFITTKWWNYQNDGWARDIL